MEGEAVCTICTEAIADGNGVALSCEHQFHGNCIIPWLQTQGRTDCPMCRHDPRVMIFDNNDSAESDSDDDIFTFESMRMIYQRHRQNSIAGGLRVSRTNHAPARLVQVANTYRRWTTSTTDARREYKVALSAKLQQEKRLRKEVGERVRRFKRKIKSLKNKYQQSDDFKKVDYEYRTKKTQLNQAMKSRDCTGERLVRAFQVYQLRQNV